MTTGLRLGLALAAFLLITCVLQQWDRMAAPSQSLQSSTVPAGHFTNRPKLRSILMRSNLLVAQPVERSGSAQVQPATLRDGELLEYRPRIAGEPEDAPSSRAAAGSEYLGRMPTLSLAVLQEHLYSSDLGILANPRQRGRVSERPAYVTYFDEAGTPRFESLAGLRVHGAESRREPYPSLRVTFRRRYGLESSPAGTLFSGNSVPLRDFIVRNEQTFAQPLAFDIAERAGCIVPRTQPVQVLLNGRRLPRPFFITERLTPQFVERLLGHDEFEMRDSRMLMQSRFGLQMFAWAQQSPAPLTLEQAARRFDVENFFSWCLSISFCGTGDFFEGPMVRDLRSPERGHFFINWDMDVSFPEADGERYPVFELITTVDGHIEIRTVLFERLMAEDPEARRRFTQQSLHTLNHDLTQEFLSERIDYYRSLEHRFDFHRDSPLTRIASFLQDRHGTYRRRLEELAGMGAFHRCVVEFSPGETVLIDGHAHHGPRYVGYYAPGSRLTLEATRSGAPLRSAWSVNGRTVESDGEPFALDVTEDLTIRLSRTKPAG